MQIQNKKTEQLLVATCFFFSFFYFFQAALATCNLIQRAGAWTGSDGLPEVAFGVPFSKHNSDPNEKAIKDLPKQLRSGQTDRQHLAVGFKKKPAKQPGNPSCIILYHFTSPSRFTISKMCEVHSLTCNKKACFNASVKHKRSIKLNTPIPSKKIRTKQHCNKYQKNAAKIYDQCRHYSRAWRHKNSLKSSLSDRSSATLLESNRRCTTN